MGEQFKLVRGARLHVRDDGGSDGGLALLWSHGLLSSMAAEARAGVWASAPGSRVIHFDARGHGLSSDCASEREARWDSYAADLLALADAAGLTSFAAGGVSMGAASALCAALAAPERVRGLVLAGVPAIWEARVALEQQYARIAAADARVRARLIAGSRTALPNWLARADPAPVDPDGMARAALLYAGAAGSDLPPPEQLRALAHVPARIIAWNGDRAHPLASAQALHRLLPLSSLEIADDLQSFQL